MEQSPSAAQFDLEKEQISCPLPSQSHVLIGSSMLMDRVLAEVELAYEREEGDFAIEQETGDSSRPTIDYEEAMKRELEYRNRKQISSLQPPASVPMLSHELTLTAGHSGEKRKEISGTQHVQATQHLSLNQERQQHQQNNTPGRQHAARSQKHLFWCNICQVHCASSSSLKMHRYSKMHRAKFEELHRGKNNPNAKMVWCEECNIPCMNQRALDQHQSGKKHMAKVEQLRAHSSSAGSRMSRMCNR